MPAVQIVAYLSSDDPIDPIGDADGSHLVLVWFQDDWAFPIDDEIVEAIVHLDWVREAADFHW